MKSWLDYSDLTYLGESNHGAYFRARPPARLNLSDDVILKVLYRGASDHQWHAVAREIRLLTALDSAYVASILDAGHLDGRLYYTLDYPALGTLQEPVRNLNSDEKLAGLQNGALGLEALHQAGVVHRDFKPAKIFMGADGGRLTDLGTADETRERQGTPVPTGSLGFMAPEVARGDHASVASDVYSLGAAMHSVLAGQPVYPDLPRRNIVGALRHVAGAPVALSLSDVPSGLRDIVEACLAPRPGDRPGSAAEVAQAIGAV